MKKIKVLVFQERNDNVPEITIKALEIDQYCDFTFCKTAEEFLTKPGENYTIVLLFKLTFSYPDSSILRFIEVAKRYHGLVLAYDSFVNVGKYRGVDYYLPYEMTEYARALMQSGSFVPMHYFKQIILNLVRGKKPSQEIESLIVEKREFYDSVIDIFDERSRQTADVEREVGLIKKILDDYRQGVVLDGGCGNGRISERLAVMGFQVTGIDINENLLEQAKKKRDERIKNQNSSLALNPQYFPMSLTDLTFPQGSFNAAIMMWHVICEFKQYQRVVFKQLHEVLCYGGLLIFDFPDIANNIQINNEGTYEDSGNGLLKYRSLVLPINQMLGLVESCGFFILKYYRLRLGIDKFIIVARKV